MSNFEIALCRTLRFEGNYSNDPNDPGSETYHGISRKYNPDWEGWKIIDECKAAKRLESVLNNHDSRTYEHLRDLVHDLYYSNYWGVMWGNDIKDQGIANVFFDACVNPGIISIKLMQRSIMESMEKNNMLTPLILKVDGIMGKHTLNAINDANSDQLLDIFRKKRIEFYENNSPDIYIQGLINRANAVALK